MEIQFKTIFFHQALMSRHLMYSKMIKKGAVVVAEFGRVVASDTRSPRFESSHWEKFIYIEHLFTVNCVLIRQK